MKIIFSLLMFPVFLIAPAIAGMTFFVYYHNGNAPVFSSETFRHIYMCALHLSVGTGLLGGLLLAVYCGAMCVMGFIIKSWYRAALAGGISFGMGYCVWYLNNVIV